MSRFCTRFTAEPLTLLSNKLKKKNWNLETQSVLSSKLAIPWGGMSIDVKQIQRASRSLCDFLV